MHYKRAGELFSPAHNLFGSLSLHTRLQNPPFPPQQESSPPADCIQLRADVSSCIFSFSFSLHYAAGFWFLLPPTESDFKCLLETAFCSSPQKLAVTELSEYFLVTAETCSISAFERGSVIFRYMQRKMHRTFRSLENLLKPAQVYDLIFKGKNTEIDLF